MLQGSWLILVSKWKKGFVSCFIREN